MLDIGKESEAKAKCYFAHTVLPHFIDDKQPPTKRKPFSTIYAQSFNHSLDIVVPASAADKVQQAIKAAVGDLQYCKVHLKLVDILTGGFFNHYIKTGNILLLSEGRQGLETTFSLCEGILRIEVDRATYERTGLQGQVIPSFGRKHVKSRYAITFNLRLPSMLKGKKGFDRILWAAENVFTDALTWLFYDLGNPELQGAGPIKEFQPFLRKAEPSVVSMQGVLVPVFPTEVTHSDEEGQIEVTELLEWLSLVCLDSPRVREDDKIDIFLSRYEVPRLGTDGQQDAKPMDLVKLHWHGFMPSVWVAKVFTAALRASGDDWFSMQVCGFEAKSHMVLKRGGTALTWEYE